MYPWTEIHPQFIFSNIPNIKNKLSQHKEVLKRMILSIPSVQGMTVKYEDLDALFRRAGLNLLKQEVVTLLRVLDPLRLAKVRMTQVLKYIMDN